MAEVIRKALQTIILYRDGSQMVVEPGAVVSLSEKEFNELRQINPDCMGKLDEAEVALMEKQETTKQASAADEPAPASTKKGAKKAPADEDL